MNLIKKLTNKENDKEYNKKYIENLINTFDFKTIFNRCFDHCISTGAVKQLPNTKLYLYDNKIYVKDGTRVGDLVEEVEELVPVINIADKNCGVFILKKKASVKVANRCFGDVNYTWKRKCLYYVVDNEGNIVFADDYTRIFVNKEKESTSVTMVNTDGDKGIILTYDEKCNCTVEGLEVKTK